MRVDKKNLKQEFEAYFERTGVDVIFYPTMPMLPFKNEDLIGPEFIVPHNGRNVSQLVKSMQNTAPASIVNYPCVSLPARNYEEGLKVGMELCAKTGNDKKLLAIAKAVEKALHH